MTYWRASSPILAHCPIYMGLAPGTLALCCDKCVYFSRKERSYLDISYNSDYPARHSAMVVSACNIAIV